jgi:hypothetical protein
MKIRFILVIIFFQIISNSLLSQQNNTLYFMHSIPQSNLTNPAMQCNCSFNISGILALPVNFELSNTGFNYSDFIHKGTGNQKDSLVFDIPNVIGKLKKTNFLIFDYYLNIFSAGFKLKDFYFSFNVTDKFNFRFGYPRDLIKAIYEGNGGSFLGHTIDAGGLGISANYYREYAFGISAKIDKKFTVGIRPKLLFGKFNIYTRKNDITWKTYDSDFGYQFHSDIEINSSQPFYTFNNLYYSSKTHQVEGNFSGNNPTLMKVMMNNHNVGFGLDLGLIYKANDRFTFSGSIIDLGIIKWKDNVNTFTSKGDFYYDGLNINPYLHGSDSLSRATGQNLQDSILSIFSPSLQKNSYNSYLTAKIFLGGEYVFNDNFSLALLTKSEILLHTIIPSVTISAIGNINDKLSGCVTYTIINNSFLNAGVGIMFKASIFQFYAVTDNLVAVFAPFLSKNVSLNLGCNLLFGCSKSKSSGSSNL